MKIRTIRDLFRLGVAIQLVFLTTIAAPVLAVGPTEPVGPTGPVGPTEPVGPTGPVGPTELVGPTGPTGATNTGAGENGASADTGTKTPTGATNTGAGKNGASADTGTKGETGANQGETQGEYQNIYQNSASDYVDPVDPLKTQALNAGGGNNQTGSNSVNDNNTTTSNQETVAVTNNANVNNSVDLDANSGNNNLSQNTKVGNFTTGDLQAVMNILNVANSEFAAGSSIGMQSLYGDIADLNLLASGDRILLPTNSNTGSNSSNTNDIIDSNLLQIITSNDANANNDLNVVADTGNNTVNANTEIGDLMTGGVDLIFNVINMLNLSLPDLTFNLDIWSIFGDVIGDINLGNDQTGSNSVNNNNVDSTNNFDTAITNTATIDNGFNFDTETGNNSIADNTTVGNITSGDVNIDGSVTNVANVGVPTFYLINVLGEWVGGFFGGNGWVNELGNSNTGSNSLNDNNINQTNDFDAAITNNATATNQINVDANTGRNTVQDNTIVGNITTGSIDIMANVMNFLNVFGSDLSEFSLGVINIFGDWLPSSETATVAANETTESSRSIPTSQGGAPSELVVALTEETNSPTNQATNSNTDEPVLLSTASTTSGHNLDSVNQVVDDEVNITVKDSRDDSQIALVAGSTDRSDPESSGNGFGILPFAIGGFLLLWLGVEILAYRKQQLAVA